MKKCMLLLAFAGISYFVSSQNSFIQGFNNGTLPDPDWIIHVGGTYSSESNSGKTIPSLMFSANSQYVETPVFNGAHTLSFWMKGSKTDSASTMQIFISCKNKWYLAQKLSEIKTTDSVYTILLPDTAEKVRFEYQKSAGNIALDDVVLYQEGLIPAIINTKLTDINDVAALYNIQTDNIGILTYMVTKTNELAPDTKQIADTSLYAGSIADYGKLDITTPDSINVVLQYLPSNTDLTVYFIVSDIHDSCSNEQNPIAQNIKTTTHLKSPFFKGIYKGDASTEKALQIFNPTNDAVNLNNYRVLTATNGNGWAFGYYFEKDKVLKPDSTYLIVNAGAEFIDIDEANEITSSVLCKFSGNDALALQKKFDNSNEWYAIDVFGNPYSSTNFNIAGKKAAANKNNAIRKESIVAGNAIWSISAGTTEENSEWTLIPLSDYGNLPVVAPSYIPKLCFMGISADGITEPSIDTINHQILFITSATVKNIQLNYTLDSLAIIEPLPDTINDFSQPVTFNIISEEYEDTIAWQVIFAKETRLAENHINEPFAISYNQKDKLLKVTQNSVENNSYLMITNTLGQTIFNKKLNVAETFINMSGYYTGAYLITLVKQGAKYSKSMFINTYKR